MRILSSVVPVSLARDGARGASPGTGRCFPSRDQPKDLTATDLRGDRCGDVRVGAA